MDTRMGFSIRKPTGMCAASGRALSVDEEYVATLVESADGLAREDFSIESWEEGARPAGSLYAFWRSVMEAEGSAKRRFIASGELVDIFEQLGESEDESRLAFRYVLALILIRKKLLVYEGSGGGVLRVRVRVVGAQPGAEPAALIEVVDPGMTDERIREVSEQLGAVIDEDGA